MTELKNKASMKIIAMIVVVIIILGIIGYSLINRPFSPKIVIDSADKEFYDEYPVAPRAPLTYTGDSLWGNYTPWIHYYFTMQTVQISPTIENLAQQFVDEYPDDVYERVKATYSFVVDNIIYRLGDDELYQYPVTTLQTREGNCGEASALLASLLYAEGLDDVALVFTNGTESPHMYVTVRLPTPTEAENPVELC